MQAGEGENRVARFSKNCLLYLNFNSILTFMCYNSNIKKKRGKIKHTQGIMVLDKDWLTRYKLKRCISGKKEAMRGYGGTRVTMTITVGQKV